MSASKLYAIAGELNVPVSFFFDGLGKNDAGPSIETQGGGVRYFLETPEGRELAQSFPKIEAVALRRRILDLVHAMSDASAVSG